MSLPEDTETQTVQGAQISRVAFRAPPLWKEEIKLWFIQLESSFEVAGISSETTKFHCLVSVLDAETLSCVRDLLSKPGTTYSNLRQTIESYFSHSESSMLRKLLQDLQLGDKRPSKLLAEMKALAGTSMKSEVIQSLWLQRLPIQVQQILSVSKEPLDDLARLADKVCEVSNLTYVNEVSDRNKDVNLQTLQQQITELQKSVERLSRTPRRSSSQSRSRSNSRSRNQPNKYDACWYHYKFGIRAKKCNKPCKFSDNQEN